MCAPITLGTVEVPHETLLNDIPRSRRDNVGAAFGWAAPTKFGRAKNVQNSARLLTTFDFDREYLSNKSPQRKFQKRVINYNRYHVGRKKLVNFGPLTKSMLTHTSGLFSGEQILGH